VHLLASLDAVSQCVPDESLTMGEACAYYARAILELLNLDVTSFGGGAYWSAMCTAKGPARWVGV